jgi:hypothetical protein
MVRPRPARWDQGAQAVPDVLGRWLVTAAQGPSMSAWPGHALWAGQKLRRVGEALAGPDVHVAVQEVRPLKAPQGDELPVCVGRVGQGRGPPPGRPSIPVQPGAPTTPRMSRPRFTEGSGLNPAVWLGSSFGW